MEIATDQRTAVDSVASLQHKRTVEDDGRVLEIKDYMQKSPIGNLKVCSWERRTGLKVAIIFKTRPRNQVCFYVYKSEIPKSINK